MGVEPDRALMEQDRGESLIALVGGVSVDVGSGRVWLEGNPVHLTPTESRLLLHLVNASGRVCTRAEVMRAVWGYSDDYGARTVDSHVRSLRRKLGDEIVRTVHGLGYAAADTAM